MRLPGLSRLDAAGCESVYSGNKNGTWDALRSSYPALPDHPRKYSRAYQALPSETRIASPLIPLDSSAARNAISSATSCCVTTRPGG